MIRIFLHGINHECFFPVYEHEFSFILKWWQNIVFWYVNNLNPEESKIIPRKNADRSKSDTE